MSHCEAGRGSPADQHRGRDKPLASPRDESGNHPRTPAEFGKAPASPAPNRNRMTMSVPNPHAAPVNAVNNDDQTTIRVRTRREP